ncbi:O-antigen ligase family protein [Rhodoferax sp.]|uniref:O-antigen ligase family protein n=1 Tax=Rhodoferax sp. TaxID=50421 RepID=UPI0025EA55EC|nr:O-antigen ligase family protein [Rhodoferax sp.]
MPAAPASNAPEITAISAAPVPSHPETRSAAWALAITLALVPSLGIPGEWVLQDTLKSALLAMGVVSTLALLLTSALRARCGEASPWYFHGLLAFPAILCLYALGSMVWSHSYLSGAEAARWCVLGVLLWTCLQVLRGGHAMVLLGGLHAGAVGAATWGAAQFWGDLSWFPQAAAPASVFVNRNFFAEYLVCTLPFSAYALAQLRSSGWRSLVALSVAWNLVALLMTGTRSALISAVIMLPVTLVVLWRYRQSAGGQPWSRGGLGLTVAILLLGLGSLATLPSSSPAIVAEGFGVTPLERGILRASSVTRSEEYTEGSFSIRALMWRASIRMLMDQPWTGVGAGAWEVHIPRYQGVNNSVETDFYAHNEPLQLLAEYGLPVGGGLLAFLLAYLLYSAQTRWQRLAQGAGSASEALCAIALCSLLGLLLVSNAGFPWRLASTGALLMVALAMLACANPRAYLADTAVLRVGLLVTGLAGLVVVVVSALAFVAESSIVRSVQTLNLIMKTPGMPPAEQQRLQTEAWEWLQKGVGIHPHYRKLTAQAADRFAATGNLEAALWAQDSIAASRPYVPDVRANQVLLNVALHRPAAAAEALAALSALQADSPRTRALDILLMRHTGQSTAAAAKLRNYFAKGVIQYDLLQFALAIGLENRDMELAATAYRLWVHHWPQDRQAQWARLEAAPADWRAAMGTPDSNATQP